MKANGKERPLLLTCGTIGTSLQEAVGDMDRVGKMIAQPMVRLLFTIQGKSPSDNLFQRGLDNRRQSLATNQPLTESLILSRSLLLCKLIVLLSDE